VDNISRVTAPVAIPLLDLQTATFDRTDPSLVAEAGSCHDCPERTGANSLLFPESDRDQCLDRECYQAKVSAHIVASIKRDPHLIQISTAWGTHANGVLGRGQYVEIAIAKPSRNGHRAFVARYSAQSLRGRQRQTSGACR